MKASTIVMILALASAPTLMGCGGATDSTDTIATIDAAAPDVTVDAQESTAITTQASLEDTDWQLVEFQSMDDAQGATRPDDPSLYTMRLNVDGTVNMRLNCNRANGTWTAEPSADPTNGRFEFGPLATTKALCPPPSLDELVAAQAEYVRGYLLKGSRLYLSLMADGGILAWESQVTATAESDEAIETAILQASPDYTKEMTEFGDQLARYVYSRIDLDGDGRDEVFVYMLGSIFCGTGGCNLMLFTPAGDGYTLVNNFPISRAPVIVSAETTNGWKNLVRLESGGGAPSSFVVHTFDGERYIEQERLPGDAEFEGTRVLAGDFVFDDGVPLEPHE